MIRSEQISQGRVVGHVAHAANPRAGVLILPTVTGVDGPMREQATVLAELGFTSLVWDPYPGEPPPADIAAGQSRATKLTDNVVASMSDCVGHMLGPMKLPVVAVLGFCLGGRYALLLAAADKRLVGCVPFYPSIRIPNKPNETLDAVALAAGIECPVHLVWGTGDTVIVHDVFVKLRNSLESRKGPRTATTVQVHPGAVHSFMRPDLQSVPANAKATRLAWPQASAFLETCLTGKV
jgi:carboxymethylenebutenolidase